MMAPDGSGCARWLHHSLLVSGIIVPETTVTTTGKSARVRIMGISTTFLPPPPYKVKWILITFQ
jgi:hypothetical protein